MNRDRTECCGGIWTYSVSVSAYSGCNTCGPEVEYSISRECLRCRGSSQYLDIPTHEFPVEFTSPEFDNWFGHRHKPLPEKVAVPQQDPIRRYK